MRIYLAGIKTHAELISCAIAETKWHPYILESFYYVDANYERLIPQFGDFLLDSGAFTFMQKKQDVDWRAYIKKYADFINRNNVKKFFELDVDSVVGYEKVLDFRKELEDLTGRQSIPVWHINRGRDEFLKSCENYGYVALGGVAGRSWSVKAQTAMPWFIKEAHKRNTKIHGLGFTQLSKLEIYHFDSVDSTTWTAGDRFGAVFKFHNGQMIRKDAKSGRRVKNNVLLMRNNFIEWVKFQIYADNHF